MAQRYMSEREFNKKLKEIQKENESIRRINKLEQERSRLRRTKKKKLTTSKLALLIMFFIVFEIVIFTELLMYKTQDLSALYVLIGIPATMILPLWRYYAKSQVQNAQGGITYAMAMKESQSQPISDENIVDIETGDESTEDLDEFEFSDETGEDND